MRCDTPNKLAILAYVSSHPGSTVQEFSEKLNMNENLVRHILYKLRGECKISCVSVHRKLNLWYPA